MIQNENIIDRIRTVNHEVHIAPKWKIDDVAVVLSYLLSLCDNQLDRGVFVAFCSVLLHHGPERVLEQLKQHVAQVRGHVHELEVLLAVKMNLGSTEQAVVIFADKLGVIDRLLSHVCQIGLCTNNADVILPRWSLVQCNVLA